MMYAIEANKLTKFYNDLLAVDHINFKVKQSEIFGFLRPNTSARQKSMRKMYWMLHRDMPKKVYDSFSNLLVIFGINFETISESEEKKLELSQVLDDAAKAT